MQIVKKFIKKLPDEVFIKTHLCSKCPHATHAKEYLNNHKKRMHAKGTIHILRKQKLGLF